MIKRLAGQATAAWSTNIGNEHDQVPNLVLTEKEGAGLQELANGIIRRYATHGYEPPFLLYVDWDCCSERMAEILDPWVLTIH